MDTMDSTSREIFSKKRLALQANDEEAKLKVSEGKDLMSVLRESVYICCIVLI